MWLRPVTPKSPRGPHTTSLILALSSLPESPPAPYRCVPGTTAQLGLCAERLSCGFSGGAAGPAASRPSGQRLRTGAVFLAQSPRHSPTPNHESLGQDHSHPGWFCRQTCLLCPPVPLCTSTGDPGQGSAVLVLGSEGQGHLQSVSGRLGQGCSALLVRAAGPYPVGGWAAPPRGPPLRSSPCWAMAFRAFNHVLTQQPRLLQLN